MEWTKFAPQSTSTYGYSSDNNRSKKTFLFWTNFFPCWLFLLVCGRTGNEFSQMCTAMRELSRNGRKPVISISWLEQWSSTWAAVCQNADKYFAASFCVNIKYVANYSRRSVSRFYVRATLRGFEFCTTTSGYYQINILKRHERTYILPIVIYIDKMIQSCFFPIYITLFMYLFWRGNKQFYLVCIYSVLVNLNVRTRTKTSLPSTTLSTRFY